MGISRQPLSSGILCEGCKTAGIKEPILGLLLMEHVSTAPPRSEANVCVIRSTAGGGKLRGECSLVSGPSR